MARRIIKSKVKKEDSAGLFIPAGLFLGFGLGFVFGNISAGIFLGMGAGFLMLAVAKNCCCKCKK